METLRVQQEVNEELVHELGDRLILGPTEFNFAHVTGMFSQSFHFRREESFYWFTGTIIGHNDQKIFAAHIMGDCGSDTYKAGDPMPIRAFGDWLGNSNKDYILGKGTEKREFQWEAAVVDLRAYLEREADLGSAKMLQIVGMERTFSDPDCSDQVSFHKLVLEAAEQVDYEINDALCECKWGLRWSGWAESRFCQLTYFGNWLKKQGPRKEDEEFNQAFLEGRATAKVINPNNGQEVE